MVESCAKHATGIVTVMTYADKAKPTIHRKTADACYRPHEQTWTAWPFTQLEPVEVIEKRLLATDTLYTNSNLANNEFFLPVMVLVLLRYGTNRHPAVKDTIEVNLSTRCDKMQALAKEDFSQKGAIFLRIKAQYDCHFTLPDSEDPAKAIIEAMESNEGEYENQCEVLPKKVRMDRTKYNEALT